MIKDLFIRQKQFFSNLSLKKKFMSIIIALLFLMLAGFGIGMLLVRRSDDLLLYNSTRGTVVYSAQVLSDRLQTVENMTRIMLGDSVLQENLAIADDPDATYIDKNNAFTALGSAVPNYYYNFKDGTGMRYISLYNDSYVSRSDYVLSANVASGICWTPPTRLTAHRPGSLTTARTADYSSAVMSAGSRT